MYSRTHQERRQGHAIFEHKRRSTAIGGHPSHLHSWICFKRFNKQIVSRITCNNGIPQKHVRSGNSSNIFFAELISHWVNQEPALLQSGDQQKGMDLTQVPFVGGIIDKSTVERMRVEAMEVEIVIVCAHRRWGGRIGELFEKSWTGTREIQMWVPLRNPTVRFSREEETEERNTLLFFFFFW